MTILKIIERLEDMRSRGKLRLLLQADGDIIVAVQSCRDGILQNGDAVEFCATGVGGGRSPKTLEALRTLSAAMEEDNKDWPCRAVPAVAPTPQDPI